jgi:hypothetical protein
MSRRLLPLLMFLAFTGCEDPESTVLSDKFSDIQANILERNCVASSCHGEFGKSLLSLTKAKAYNSLMAMTQHETAKPRYPQRVVPGKPEQSFVYIKITAPKPDEGLRMPERGTPLTAEEIEAIRRWIVKGAPND